MKNVKLILSSEKMIYVNIDNHKILALREIQIEL